MSNPLALAVADIKNGFRSLLQNRGFALIAVLTLGLGIGANTAIFTVVKAVLIDRLPVLDPEQLVSLVHHNEKKGFNSNSTPYADVITWQSAIQSIKSISAYTQTSGALTGAEEPYRVVIAKVNATFFPLLGVQPFRGRFFTQEEDRPGGDKVALVTYSLFQRWFGDRWKDSGLDLQIDGERFLVVGVLPEKFRFIGQQAEVYLPLAHSGARTPPLSVSVYGRISAGMGRVKAEAELDRITAETIARDPRYKGWRLQMGEVADWISPDVRMSLWALQGAVALVLFVACLNVASLMLSRSISRRREMAIRAALGASRTRLLFQILAEGVPLGMLGGALGLLVAHWSVRLLPLLDVSRIPRVAEIRIDGPMLTFTAAVAVLTCLLVGLAPAVSQSRAENLEALRESGRTANTGLGTVRLRSALVIAEIGLALVLAVGAALMMKTFYTLSSLNPGFEPANLLTVALEPQRSKFKSKQELAGYYEQILERVRSLPGAKAAGLTSSLPLGGNYFRSGFVFEGQPTMPAAELPVVNLRTVDGGYFQALQIPLARGRFFDARDREGSEPVVIINETTARRFFPGQDPIGKRAGYPQLMMTVIGVVKDVRHTDISQEADTEILLPFMQVPMLAMTLVVRSDVQTVPEPARLIPGLRRAIADVDRNLPLFRMNTMDRIMAERLGARRLNMVLLILFALLTLLLAAMGIYGVLECTVAGRSQEIAIRIALGAQRRDVIGMVVFQAMILVGIGLAAGIACSIVLGRLVQSLLYGVRETDPPAFAASILLLAAAGALASWLPARRAASVDPVVALRWE